jgi:hypothetical protein
MVETVLKAIVKVELAWIDRNVVENITAPLAKRLLRL